MEPKYNRKIKVGFQKLFGNSRNGGKEEQEKRSGKHKTKIKLVDSNSNISVITTNRNGTIKFL